MVVVPVETGTQPRRSRGSRWIPAFAGMSCFLAACATAPTQPLPDLARVPESFEVSGRLAVRQEQRSDIAKLRWTRNRGADVWVIASPLGNEVARVQSDASGATLDLPDGSEVSAPTFESLTERILGVGLDPDEVAGWLHGHAPAQSRGGWKVSIDETQHAGAVELARRLTATRGDTVVRLVIDDYRAIPE